MSTSDVSLPEAEKTWWKKTIKEFRTRFIPGPSILVENVLDQNKLTKTQLKNNVETLIVDLREIVFEMYLEAENKMNAALVSHLISTRAVPNSIFKTYFDFPSVLEIIQENDKDKFHTEFASKLGAFTGSIAPYLYELNLSSTNSRRARAGSTLEALLEKALEIYGVPFHNQSALGKNFFEKHRIGKKVDLIIPSKEAYETSRSKCAIVSVKTSLRERWQEVVEELHRSNVPHIYLATLDTSITQNQVDIMKEYNITLVVRKSEKKEKFEAAGTVESFQEFFDKSIPHILRNWNLEHNA